MRAVGRSREVPVPPVVNAASVPALRPCADAKPDEGLLCGRLAVPEDRSKPGGRGIELSVTVVPPSATPRQPDPMFFFAGDPGEQATRAAPFWAGSRSSAIVTSSTSAARARPGLSTAKPSTTRMSASMAMH